MMNILVLRVACYTELENTLINLQTSLFNVYFMFNVSFETKLFMQYQKYFIKAIHMYINIDPKSLSITLYLDMRSYLVVGLITYRHLLYGKELKIRLSYSKMRLNEKF